MSSKIYKKTDSKEGAVIIEKAYFRKGGKEIRLTKNVYGSFKLLKNYLPFIKELVEKTEVDAEKYKLKRSELNKFIYYMYIYFLLHWDMINPSKQTQWCNWINLKNLLEKDIKKNDVIILDYSKNIAFYEEYIKKNFSNKIITKNKRLLNLLNRILGFGILTSFLLRGLLQKIFRRKMNLKNKKILMITNYDRYYSSNGFFNKYLLEDKDFSKQIRKLFGEDIKRFIRLYAKYGMINIEYLKELSKDHQNLFLEDLLNLKAGFKILISKKPKINTRKLLSAEEDWDKRFLTEMYEDFLTNKFKFSIWIFLSIEKFLTDNQNITLIIGDSEKNFLFYIINLYKKIKDPKIRTLALSHEVITKDYFYTPINELFDDTPDYKFVWSKSIKKLLIEKFNYPKRKLKVFIDPRFLKWKYFPYKKNSILIVSQGYISFYHSLINVLNKSSVINKIINMGGKIYLKPHPAELSREEPLKLINLIKNKYKDKVEIITNLDFVPQFAIGKNSTLLYELYINGSTTFFINSENTFSIEKKEFKKLSKKSLESAFLEIEKEMKIRKYC